MWKTSMGPLDQERCQEGWWMAWGGWVSQIVWKSHRDRKPWSNFSRSNSLWGRQMEPWTCPVHLKLASGHGVRAFKMHVAWGRAQIWAERLLRGVQGGGRDEGEIMASVLKVLPVNKREWDGHNRGQHNEAHSTDRPLELWPFIFLNKQENKNTNQNKSP